MSRGLVVFLAFLGVFVAGGVTGGVIALRVQRSIVHQRAAERFTQQQFKRVADELSLTPGQREQLRPILHKAGSDIQARRQDILRILRKMEDDVRSQLTEAQRQKYDAARAKQRENLRTWRDLRSRRLERLESRGESESESAAPSPSATPAEESKPTR
jgi:uncharacterized membrane protein